MRYQFHFYNKPGNLLKMALYTTYTSFVGVINAVFTAAMGVLFIYACRQLSTLESGSGLWYIVLPFSLLGFLFFPLIQPVLIYRRMKNNLKNVKDETVLSFDEKSIYVKVGEQHETHHWTEISSVVKRPWQIALYLNSQHGFVIPNEAMGDKKEEFYQFALSKVKK